MRMPQLCRALFAIAISAVLAVTVLAGPASASAATVDPDKGQAKATYIRGVAVKAGNGAPLSGILVTIRDIDDLSVIGSDVTNANGVYRIDGLTGDEFAVKLNGRSRSFETGFLACGGAVVPTWGQACAAGTGNQIRARLQHL